MMQPLSYLAGFGTMLRQFLSVLILKVFKKGLDRVRVIKSLVLARFIS